MHELFKFCLPINILGIVIIKLRDYFGRSCSHVLINFRLLLNFIWINSWFLSTLLHHDLLVSRLLMPRWVWNVHLVRVLLFHSRWDLMRLCSIEHSSHVPRSNYHPSDAAIHISTALSGAWSIVISFGENVAKYPRRMRYRTITTASTSTCNVSAHKIIRFASLWGLVFQ
jgi:hypothetical protein